MKRVTPNRSMLFNEKPSLIEKDIQPSPRLTLNTSNYCLINHNNVTIQKQKEIQDLLNEYSKLQERIKKINQRLDELRR